MTWARGAVALIAALVLFLVSVAASPEGAGATVSCPASGAANSGCGTMTVSPTFVAPGVSGRSFTFTFNSGNNTFPGNSALTLAVPTGWSSPSLTPGAAGQISIVAPDPSTGLTPCTQPALGTGDVTSISGGIITVNVKCQSPHSGFGLTYSNVTTPAATGIYTFTTATRIGQNGSFVSLNESPTIDVTSATIAVPSIVSPADGSYSNGGTLSTGPLVVSGSGIAGDTVTVLSSTASCAVAGTPAGSPTTVNSAGQWTVGLTSVTPGVYYFTAQASLNGTLSSLSNCVAVTVDQTNPTVAISSGPTGFTNNTQPSFTWTGTDNVTSTGNLLYAYKLDGPGTTGSYSTFDSGTGVTLPTLTTDGQYTLSVESMDQAGNTSAAATRSFTLDTTKPALTVSHTANGSNGWNSSSPVTVSVTASDSGSGLNGVPTCSDGSSSLTLTAGAASGTWTASISGDGTHSISCSVSDTAGNTNTASDTVRIDTAAPTNLTATPAGGTYNASQSVTLSAGDATSGVNSIFYTTDGSVPTSSSTAYSAPFSIGATTTLKFIAVDTAGNTSSVHTESYVIDTVPPTVTVSVPVPPSGQDGFFNAANLTASGGHVTVQVSATDSSGVTGLSCTDSINGGSPGDVTVTGQSTSGNTRTGSFNLSADGVHSLTCTATDGVGNSGAAAGSSNTGTVKIDTTAPTVGFAAGQNGGFTRAGTTTDPLNITGTSEAGSTVSLFVDSTTCGGTGSAATADGSGNWTVSLNSLSTGAHTFTVSAVDPAGNSSGCSTSITGTVDRSAPTSHITFPSAFDSPTTWSTGCSQGPGICGTASDDSSGVASVYVAIQNTTTGYFWNAATGQFDGNGGWAPARGTVQPGGAVTWYLPVPAPPDGTYAVASGAIDYAGNVEQTLQDSVCGTQTLDQCYAQGGALNTTGGALNTTGGALNTTGGALNTTGGALNTTGGALNTTGGALNTTGGALNTTGGTGGSNLGNMVMDSTPPTLNSISVDGQTQDQSIDINPAAPVQITFDEAMDQTSILNNIHLSPAPASGSYTVSCGTDSTCQNVQVTGLQPATYYTLTIGGGTAPCGCVTDLAGNPKVATTTFHFTTAAASPPTTNTADSDGDGIPDAWDGTTTPTFTDPVTLQTTNTQAWGFLPNHKDLCLVENYMNGATNGGTGPSYNQEISGSANRAIAAAYERHGIHMVIFEGDAAHSAGLPAGYSGPYFGGAIPMTDPLGSVTAGAFNFGQGNATNPNTSYDSIRTQYFIPTGLAQFCHYALIAHSLGGTTATGSSRGFGASDLVTSLGIADNGVGSDMQQAGTVMHELGHNLGLHHGGGDDTNYKPNYLSIMSYYYQFTGVLENTGTAGSQACSIGNLSLYCLLDYSEGTLASLDKTSLDETSGLAATSSYTSTDPLLSDYAMKHKCGSTSIVVLHATGPIDWNCNSTIDSAPVAYNINAGSSTDSPLAGYNDWANLNFLVGSIGLGNGTGSKGPVPVDSDIDIDPDLSGGVDSIDNVANGEQQSNVQQAAPTVTLNPPSSIPYGTSLTAGLFDATSTVPGSFTYNPPLGTVLPVGSDTITVTFTPNDTVDFSSVQKTVTIDVPKADQTITFGALAGKTYGDAPFDVSATASSGLPVSFSVGSTDNCTISGTTVTITGAGSCTVTASQSGNDTYNAAANVSQTFSIARAAQAITISTGAPASAVYNTQFTVAATGGNSGNAVTFSASGVCTNSGATFTMTSGTGTCTVAYDQAGNDNYNAAPEKTQVVTAARANQAINVATHAPSTAVYNAQFTVAATAPAGAVSYSSSGSCSNSAATFTMTSGTGTCSVMYDQPGNDNYNPATEVTESVTAQKAGQSISVSTHAPLAAVYGTQFTVLATASSGLPVAYGSSGVCSVSGASYTMTSGTGTCTVTYDQAGNANYSGATEVTESVSAQKANQTINFTAPTGVTYGDPDSNLGATASSGLAVSYSSSTTAVCTIVSGRLHVVAAGTCTLTASQGGDSNYNPAANVQRTFTIAKANQLITVGTPAPTTAAFNAQFQVAATAPGGSIAYGSSGVCTNNGTTYTMTAGSGTCTVTFDQSGNGNYFAAPEVTESVTATKAAQTITFGSLANRSYGDPPFTVSATASSGLTVSFSAVGSCTSSGTNGATITITGNGTCTVTANQPGNDNYSAAPSVSRTFSVGLGSMYVLDPIAGQALYESGQGCLQSSGNIYVNSSASNAIYQGGQGCTVKNTASYGHAFNATGGATISVVGGFNSICCTPAPLTGIASGFTGAADPFATTAMPAYNGGWYAAGSSTQLTTQTVPAKGGTLKPGVYVGGISLSGGSYTMQSGVYVLDGGGFTVSSTTSLSGSGVFIYNSNHSSPASCGAISVSASGTVTLTSGASGPDSQILLAQDRACATGGALSGSSGLSLTGAVYLPGASLTLSGKSTSVPTWQTALVARTVTLTGQGVMSLSHL